MRGAGVRLRESRELRARRGTGVELEGEYEAAPAVLVARIGEPLPELRAHRGIAEPPERRRRRRAKVGRRNRVEQEAPRRGVVLRETSDLQHRGGGDVGAPAGLCQPLESRCGVERAAGDWDRVKGNRLVGVVEDEAEERRVRKPPGEDQRKCIDPHACHKRIRYGVALARERQRARPGRRR